MRSELRSAGGARHVSNLRGSCWAGGRGGGDRNVTARRQGHPAPARREEARERSPWLDRRDAAALLQSSSGRGGGLRGARVGVWPQSPACPASRGRGSTAGVGGHSSLPLFSETHESPGDPSSLPDMSGGGGAEQPRLDIWGTRELPRPLSRLRQPPEEAGVWGEESCWHLRWASLGTPTWLLGSEA